MLKWQNERCEECALFNPTSGTGCNKPGYGTLGTNHACYRFKPKPSLRGTKETNPKYSEGTKKAPLHCIPCGPLFELGLAMFEGSRKYGRHNYRATGVRASTYYDAMIGHIMDWWEGEDIDPESGLHHLVKATTAMFIIRDSMLMGNFNDDRPPKYPEKHGRTNFDSQVARIVKRIPNCVEPFLEINRNPDRTKPVPGGD